MADYGKKILGLYSASCEKLRQACPVARSAAVGNLVFFADPDAPKATHVGLIYKVDGNMIYTVEGDVPSGIVAVVATKSYSKAYDRIMSYGAPKYTSKNKAEVVIDAAIVEVGYVGKQSKKYLNNKTADPGPNNYTKYGKWMDINGKTWNASFISWCFHVAYDSSSTEVTGSGEARQTAVTSTVTQTRYNSSLVTYVNRISSANANVRTGQITKITVHSAKALGDIHTLAQLMNTSTTQCYNYGIDSDGVIGLFVDEIMWTNSSNSTANDSVAVNIVCMNSTLEPNYEISDECYAALVKLCEDICRRNFIFELIYRKSPEDSLTLHSYFNPKVGCPGPYLTKKLQDLAHTVTRTINVQTGTNYRQVSSRLASSQAEALKIQSTVAIKSIKPYVVQPHRTTLGIDYVALRHLGVVGTFIDAGERYNSSHQIVQYRTDNVYKQTEEARAAGVPHAYFYTTRARTVAEVKEEASWFYYVVTKYPPKLGVWLHCAFSVKSSTAQTLVDEWYKYFVRWGLKSKCGLYATKKQCTKIGWPKQCAYMPLWLEGEMTDSVCPDEEILTPSFFKLNDLSNQSARALEIADEDNSSTLVIDEDLADDSTAPTETSVETENKVALPDKNPKAGATNGKDVSEATKRQSANYQDIDVPKTSNYTGFKKWESYTSLDRSDGQAYDITHADEVVTDSDGFRMLDNRYLVAVGSGVCNTVGTYIDIILENGTVIECIMGHGKPNSRTDEATHIFSVATKPYCCSEFIVVNREGVLNPTVRRSGDCSDKQEDWKSPVKSFRVYKKNWFNKEE